MSLTQKIRNDNVIPQESKVYRKPEWYKLFRKESWFGAVHPNIQIDAKIDYAITRVLKSQQRTSLSFYKRLRDLGRNLKQTAFFTHTKVSPLGLFYHGKQKYICYTEKLKCIA